jgi:hypothetical protein
VDAAIEQDHCRRHTRNDSQEVGTLERGAGRIQAPIRAGDRTPVPSNTRPPTRRSTGVKRLASHARSSA